MNTPTETKSVTLKPAPFGSVSSGTLRTQDLLSAFVSALEGLMLVNGEYFSRPENFVERDRLCDAIGEAQDCFIDCAIEKSDFGEIDPDKEETAEWLVNETLFDMLQSFAPPYTYFSAHPGDGADFGFWLSDIEDIRDQVEFVSSKEQEYPPSDFRGEWLHVNDHGNCTLYVRVADDRDNEIWSVV